MKSLEFRLVVDLVRFFSFAVPLQSATALLRSSFPVGELSSTTVSPLNSHAFGGCHIQLFIVEASMPKTSKELLDHVERPSLLDGLLLGHKDLAPRACEGRHQSQVNLKERQSCTPLPKSQVLGKVQEFLLVMAKANQDLELKTQEKPSSNYDIEVLNDDEKEYIEMDLLLGVTDLHSEEAITAAEESITSFRPTVAPGSSSSSDDDDNDDDENDHTNNTTLKHTSKSTKHYTDVNELSTKNNRNKRPKVVMLD